MDVLGRVEGDDGAVLPTGGDDRDLALEIDQPFQDQRHAAQRLEGAVGAVLRAAKQALALAVIAHPARLQDAAAAESGERGLQIGLAADRFEGGGGDAAAVQEALLRQPVLRGLERLGGRKHRPLLVEVPDGLDGHVLELVGDDVGCRGELRERRRGRHRRRRSAGTQPRRPDNPAAAPGRRRDSRDAPRPSPASGRAGRRR